MSFEAQLRRFLSQLPQENRQTLAFLVLHLQNAADSSAHSQMNASNLAKCLGPSIVGTVCINSTMVYFSQFYVL